MRHSEFTNRDGLVFIEPLFTEKVWGGSRLCREYGYKAPSVRVGECLVVSARPEGDCAVRSKDFPGYTLSALWEMRRDLFGGLEGDEFPLRVKLIDAREDLSVQVHPDDGYAKAHERDSGKNECWYVLSASDCGQVLLGHSARTHDEFVNLASEGKWEALLSRVGMCDGDFFDVPAGTVHAILAGSLIYEVQQSSDVTYRLHDHHRRDGSLARELHLEKACDVVTVPSLHRAGRPIHVTHDGATERLFTRNEHFAVSRLDVSSEYCMDVRAPFLLIGVLKGSGCVNGETVVPGQHFLVPATVRELDIHGPLSLMVTRP